MVGMAVAGGRTADIRESGRGPLTVVAIGLNPLLLVEGPLGGHNDFIGAFFVMLAAVLSARGSRAAWLAVGLAVAIKATAVGVIPLLAYEHWRSRPEVRWSGLAWLLALTLLPVVGLSLFFGGPLVLIDAVRARLDVARVTGPALWLARALLLSALVLGLWMVRSGPTGSWVTGWAVVALAVVFASTTLRFPWFLVWALAPVLTAWDERHRILITLACACAFLLMWMYTIGP